MIGGGRKNSKNPNTVKYVDRDDYTLATKMMLKFCDLSLKTIYITHKHKKIEMQVLLSQEKKKHNNFPKKLHTYFITSFEILLLLLLFGIPNRKLILHLNYIYIYLHHSLGSPAFRAALCK